MKRQHQSSSKVAGATTKRQRKHTLLPTVDIKEESIHEQAEKYRLCTAIFRTDSLTPIWTIGVNRPIQTKHIQRLFDIFESDGLHRLDPRHRLLVACTKEEVEKMQRNACQAEGERIDANIGDSDIRHYENWERVVGSKAELLAGNHRVAALAKFSQKHGKGADNLWWVCEVYDKGTWC